MGTAAFECSVCGAATRAVRGDYQFTECGLKSVLLRGIKIIRCSRCGNQDPIIPRLTGLMRLLARAVVRKPFRLAGDEVRFLRKYLQMTQDQFSRLVDVDKSTLSKWENDEDPVGPQSDRLIRAITVVLGEGLRDEQEQAVRHFPQIKNLRKSVHLEMNAETMSAKYVA